MGGLARQATPRSANPLRSLSASNPFVAASHSRGIRAAIRRFAAVFLAAAPPLRSGSALLAAAAVKPASAGLPLGTLGSSRPPVAPGRLLGPPRPGGPSSPRRLCPAHPGPAPCSIFPGPVAGRRRGRSSPPPSGIAFPGPCPPSGRPCVPSGLRAAVALSGPSRRSPRRPANFP